MEKANSLPRELVPGVWWLGDCLEQQHRGKIYHSYNAAFLIAGEHESLLVETGHPKDFPVIEQHMHRVLAQGSPPARPIDVLVPGAAGIIPGSVEPITLPCHE